MSLYRKKIGKLGEQFTKEFFLKKGYEIINENWQKRGGEIDLICQKDNEIVFVEVKTRTKDLFGWPEQAVTASKKKKIYQVMNQFLFENEKYSKMMPRFDIVSVELYKLTPKFIHFENIVL